MAKKYWQKAIASLLLSCGMLSILGNEVRAESPETLPSNLRSTIAAIEKAANDQDLSKLITFYNDNFTNSDGLTVEVMSQSLEQIWETYPRLLYRTTVESWEQQGDFLVVETLTKMSGSQKDQGRDISLTSTVRSRQFFVNAIAPETVKVGEKYNFDVIVTEPLGEKVLLGAALEEKASTDLYLNPSSLELEPLSAGGIYKVVTAPLLPDNNWLSAIVVRSDGITMVTKRVKIER